MAKTTSETSQILSLFLRSTLRNRKVAALSLLSPIGVVLTNIGIPYFATRALTSINSGGTQFKQYMIGLVVVAASGILANRIGFIKVMELQAITMSDLHALIFSRILHRGIGFHTNRIGGKLVSDALDFVSAYSGLLMSVYNTGFSFVLVLLTGLILVAINSWILGLFVFITVGSTLFFAYRESITRRDLRTIRLNATKQLTGHLSDSIVNAQTVKTFAGEEHEIAENNRLNMTLRELRIKDWSRASISGNNRSAILVALMVLLLFVVNYSAHRDSNAIATGLFAFTYTFTLLLRLFDINVLTRQVEESFLQATPAIQILNQPDEIIDVPGAADLQVSKGAITFENVKFQYTDGSGNQNVFDNFNLSVKPGEKIGVVGPSGGGKTTLTRLLLRFEDIQGGSIQIDDQNIAAASQSSLRKNIAYVPQEPLLFHRSIEENIAYGKPRSSHERVTEAADLASAHDFIIGLPSGYKTIVGERGVKLSGGQRQRVAIARAILKDAPVLVLDEATSALDSESEAAIQKALTKLMKGRTTLVIAHRLSTIQKMDRIIVLDGGVIVEEGSHQDLLENDGLYARLWAHQTDGFIEE